MDRIIENKKTMYILVAIIIAIVALFVVVNLLSNKKEKLTEIEEIKLKEVSNDVMNYMEAIENTESTEIDRYIIYALLYSYNENDNNTLSSKEIVNLIKDKFTIEISEDKVREIGITPDMLYKNISYDSMEDKFILNQYKQTYADIAATEIVKYNLTSIAKEKGEYTLTYDKYVATNPYEILNYYMDKNNEMMNANRDEETGEILNSNSEYEPVDTSEIDGYLRGKEKVGTIKKYIVEENLSRVAEKRETIKVIYVVKENKLLIDRIEK